MRSSIASSVARCATAGSSTCRFDPRVPRWRRRSPTPSRKAYIDMNLDFRFTSTKDASEWLEQQLSEQRKRRRGRRGTPAAVSREERRALARGSAEHRRAEARRPERRGHEGQDRTAAEGSDVPPAAGNSETTRTRIDTFPAILANYFIQQQKTELASLQRKQAQLAEKFGEKHPEMIEVQSPFRPHR